MKNLKISIISVLVIIALLLVSTICYASNTTLVPSGASSVTKGSSNTITVKLTSSSSIGGVMGVIEKTSNVTINSVTPLNNWNMMSYNAETGDFNMIKNDGAQNEDIIKIDYTVANSEGTGKIEIKNITVSDIVNYDEEEIDDVSVEFSIVEPQEEPGGDTPSGEEPGGDTPSGEEPGGDTPSGEEPGGDTPSGEIPGGTTPSGGKTDPEQTNGKTPDTTKSGEKTTSKKDLSNAGLGIGLGSAIVIAIGAGVFGYIKYRKYNNI